MAHHNRRGLALEKEIARRVPPASCKPPLTAAGGQADWYLLIGNI